MRIDFYEPPAAEKVGGLDQAICSLRDFLEANSIKVRTNPFNDDEEGVADIVHFHGIWQRKFLRASQKCRQRGIPYLVSPHGMLEPWAWRHKRWKKLPYYYLVERFHLQKANMILATSEQEASNLLAFFAPQKVATIPLGLPDEHRPARDTARAKLGWVPEELVLLYLSRIHPKKGLNMLLRALGSIANTLPQKWRLVIIGAGDEPYLALCQQSCHANEKVFAHTEWKGPIWGDAKWAYLQGADLFCLPSFSENFGLAILEACQVGTRVLTSPATPWSFLEHTSGAFLVEPKVESIAAGLIRFLKAREWGNERREALATDIHARFNWQTVGQQYLELYRRVISSSHSATVRV